MKKVLSIFLFIFIILGVVGCSNKTLGEDAIKFKKEYESYNEKENSSGVLYRSVSIDEDNPFIYISAEDVVKKIIDKETFYLYIGDKQCPWCRSSIESAIKVAKENNIDKIYYVPIWNDDHEEILRDKYSLKDGVATLEINGTDAYYELLENFDSVLADYTLTDEDGNSIDVGEKRIYAPNYFYIEKGKTKTFITGTSKEQDGPNVELTEKILEDQEEEFNKLFNN